MAYYAKENVFRDPEVMERMAEILQGRPRLDWMKLEIERVRCRPSKPGFGLRYEDTNVGSYGWDRIPEKIRHNFSMAPRGAVLPPGLPHMGYDVNRKSEVFSENAALLFEESKSRHWAPTRELPWTALQEAPYPEDVERALAQLYTDLTEVATILGDVPARWVWRINHELVELKSWLCAQMFDAAKLADLFRKRAIAGGAGLGHDYRELEDFLKGVFDSGTYPCASASSNLLLAGFAQVLLRHIGARAGNPVDQKLVRFALQDVSRMLAYGVDHLRHLLAVRPHEAPGIAGHLEEMEQLLVGVLGSRFLPAALAVVSAGGRRAAPEALPEVRRLYETLRVQHLERCRAAGLPERPGRGPLGELVEALG